MRNINYLYYILMFFLIFTLNILNLPIETNIQNYKIFFLIDIVLQILLEIVLLILLEYLIKTTSLKKIYILFPSFLMLILCLHTIDFILTKIMNLSLYKAFYIVLHESWDNFKQMILLTEIPIRTWIICLILSIFFLCSGFFLYKLSHKISNKKPIHLSIKNLLSLFLLFLTSLLFWDAQTSWAIRKDVYISYKKALPFKFSFFKKNRSIPFSLPPYKKHNVPIQNIEKRPNIYLFITESLREDYITEKNSPSLENFKKENISLTSFANSNNTQTSWFSIFYSKYPLQWPLYKNTPYGSFMLNILKNAGYDIRVYTSSHLKYYKMQDILFGKKKHLLTSFYYPKNLPPYQRDIFSFKKLGQDAKKNPTSNLFIIFLESTHFKYSFPKESFYPPPSLLQKLSKKNMAPLKKRYKKSISFLDSLFSSFLQKLKKHDLYDDSIIIFTSDHGEEFYEKGCLFHASNLSREQTAIPLFFKFPQNPIPKKIFSSHIDIFPTIFDILHISTQSFDGVSIFQKKEKPILCTKYNGSLFPDQFFIFDGKDKIFCKIKNNSLEILSVKDFNDHIKEQKNISEKGWKCIKKLSKPMQ